MSTRFGAPAALAGARLVDLHKQEVHEGEERESEGESERRDHPAPRDEQAADRRGGDEADPGGHADEAVRLVAPVLGHEQSHERRQRDVADVACDHSEHDSQDEQPQRNASHLGKAVLRNQQAGGEASRIERERNGARGHHHGFLAVMIHEAPEPDAERRGEREIDAGDHPGREHRPRFQEYPESHREPDREIGDARNEVVGEEMMERRHSARRERVSRIAPPTNRTMMDSMPARVLSVRSAVIPTIAGPSTAANLPIML